MKNIVKWTTLAFMLSFFVALGMVPTANALTVTDILDVQAVSSLGGTIYNPHTSVTVGDNLDLRGYLHNEAGQIIIQDDIVVNGKIISNLQQVYGGVTDYQGTIFNSTADVTIGDNLMVDGYMWRRAGDIKLFDGVTVQGDLYPYETMKYNLGTSSKKWKNLYTGNLTATNLMFSDTISGPNGVFSNDVFVGNELTVNKAATLNDTLTVEGLTTINGGLTADGGVLTVADNTGDLYTGGTLMVDNNADFGSNLTLVGMADVQTNLYSSAGDLVLNDNIVVNGTSNLNGDTVVDGNLTQINGPQVTFDGNVDANNGLDVTGDATFNNMAWFQSGIDVDGTAEFDGTVMLTNGPLVNQGNTQFQGNLGVWGASSFQGPVDLQAPVVNTSGNFGGNILLADGVTVAGPLANLGNTQLQGNLGVWGVASFQDDVYLGNDPTDMAYVSGGINVNGLTTLSGGATLGGDINMGTNRITNIGTLNSQFDALGGLALESDLYMQNNDVWGIGSLNSTSNVTFDMNNAADTTLTLTNSGAGIAHLNVGAGAIQGGTITGTTLTDGTFSTTGGTITGATWNSDVIATAYGGLGADVSAAGVGELVYSDSTTTYATLGAGTAGYLLQANGASAPSWTDVSAWDQNASDDLTTATNFAGDVTGVWNTTVVGDDSHAHTSATISGLGVSNFSSANISQWTNDSGYLTSYTETDPIFVGSAANGITNAGSGLVVTGAERTNWNAAFTHVTTDVIETAADVNSAETDPVFNASAAASITSGAGAPAGACTTGDLYTDTAGAAGTTLYVCEAAAWAAK